MLSLPEPTRIKNHIDPLNMFVTQQTVRMTYRSLWAPRLRMQFCKALSCSWGHWLLLTYRRYWGSKRIQEFCILGTKISAVLFCKCLSIARVLLANGDATAKKKKKKRIRSSWVDPMFQVFDTYLRVCCLYTFYILCYNGWKVFTPQEQGLPNSCFPTYSAFNSLWLLVTLRRGGLYNHTFL